MIFIDIKNLRDSKPTQPWEVRVDRASVLGNPFRMVSEDQRNTVCEQYEQYFNDIVRTKSNEEFMNELRRLYKLAKKYGKLTLFCWCAPKRCHAETIKRFLWKHLEPDPTYDCDQ
jgi:hypothetical protein